LEFASIKGFRDILPARVGSWQKLESAAARVFESFGFREIRTPILERTELFQRSIGQDTDIVAKEMYTLSDSKGRGLTLRPEATASVTRAYIQHRLYQDSPVSKLFSIGPMFRHERPQKGRLRQFHQINAELYNDPGPKSDAELIVMVMYLFDSLDLKDLSLHLNSLGCPRCRPAFRERLTEYLRDKADLLCEDCRRRSKTNPLRVFDCKVEGCRQVVSGAPSILEFICEDCRRHFDSVNEFLTRSGIEFSLDSHLVRGLDYYTRTTFEVQTEHLGAQNAVAGGGRYDDLVRLLGGPDHPAVGFAVGMERVVALLEGMGGEGIKSPELFIAALGEEAEALSFHWANALRKSGLRVEIDYGSRSLKGQMKRADRLGSPRVLIVGEDELASGQGILRDMKRKTQESIDLADAVRTIKDWIAG